ncbi:DUF5984 family protein [Streptodolium elevatio]|uniref:DUF5984 family protein n=1 Tax=Streptodolium elevatio TaxID=3157996 RepID=A0ABV3DTB1_9ACTN
MIRFRFGLRPVDEVRPWGDESPRLSWFILTDGWYCVDAGGHELLRYARPMGSDPFDVHVDYHVVRLWEDVLDVLPAALEPVPSDLRGFVAAEAPGRWPTADVPADARDAVEAAVSWHDAHTLDMGHLADPPELRFWRTADRDGDDTVTLSWQHPPDSDVEFDASATGRVTVSSDAFIAAVTEFDRALLSEMDRRVTELESCGPPPGVSLDLIRLRAEQRDRAAWLRRAYERPSGTRWDDVRTGAQVLMAVMGGERFV